MSDARQRRRAPIRSISAVIPVRDEAANLVMVAEAALEALGDAVPDFELIIVDDGSRDATRRLADDLARQHPEVQAVHHPRSYGYGAAWRSGLAAATKQYIFFMDADRRYSPSELQRLMQWNDLYDIVAGYRIRRNDPPQRLLSSWLYSLLMRLLFGVKLRDLNSGFKLFRASLLKSMDLQANGALIHTEIHYRAQQQGASMREVGIGQQPRRPGRQAGISPRAMLQTVRDIVALRRRIKRERQTPTTAESSPHSETTPQDDARSQSL